MKIIILILNLLFVTLTFSQKRAIKIINQNSGKEIIIKENKRIRIKTVDGQKISGRFRIEDKGSIIIKNKRIELRNIQKIKRNPLLLSITTNVYFIYIGVATIIVSVAVSAITAESSLLLLSIPGSGMIYAGIKSPNLLKGYKKTNNWTYEIVTSSE